MPRIRVLSFDMEGTLVSHGFSTKVWHEGIPSLYAKRAGITLEEAKKLVEQHYDEIGEHRPEWYDINYWFQHFEINDPERLLENYNQELIIYPEVRDTLQHLSQTYPLIVASSSARDFLQVMTRAIGNSFDRVFSAISDCGHLKSEDFYLMICREMGIAPEEMVHVGDHWEFDYLFPRRVGIEAFHLDRSGETAGQGIVKDLREFEDKLAELDARPFP